MSWEHVLAILVGWIVLPAFAWALAQEVLHFIRSPRGLIPFYLYHSRPLGTNLQK
jgi:hypothetical protein